MKTSVENNSETKWKPIFKDMAILMCVMGAIALICKLIMEPFEITTPTDTLVSLIRKGSVSAVKHNDQLVVMDKPFVKELRKVVGRARKDEEEKSILDKVMDKLGFGEDPNKPLPNVINAQDNTGRTPLMWAVYSNYNNPPTADVLDDLFSQLTEEFAAYKKQADAKIGSPGKKPTAQEIDSAREQLEKAVAKLNDTMNELQEQISKGTSITWNKKDVQRLYYLRELLQAPGVDVNMTDQDGFTALHWAAWSGMPYCCFTLVQAGLDINAKENNGYTPLMLAAMRGNADTVELLLRLGADKQATNAKGATAAALATAAAASYHKSDTVVYKFIYSKKRDAFYVRTVGALTGGVAPISTEEIEKQMNLAWMRYERQLLAKAKNKKATEDQEVKSEEEKVQDAAGEPAFSGDDAQENP